MRHHLRKLQGLVKVADGVTMPSPTRGGGAEVAAMEGDRPARRLE